ncbi:MAG: hypothetical protein JSV42_05860 [Chloroflexota bacterium]|nr:MAG: hypothetical protein JSV42_05860 [Chloroflexota bacterium]
MAESGWVFAGAYQRRVLKEEVFNSAYWQLFPARHPALQFVLTRGETHPNHCITCASLRQTRVSRAKLGIGILQIE